MPKEFLTGYMDEVLLDLAETVEYAVTGLSDVDFDTLVGTGLSGAVFIPALAMRMGKHFAIIRKRDDDSHHGRGMAGVLGERWVFVDDFISQGSTKNRVMRVVQETSHITTTYVGDYLYSYRAGEQRGYTPAEEEVTVHRNPEPTRRDQAAIYETMTTLDMPETARDFLERYPARDSTDLSVTGWFTEKREVPFKINNLDKPKCDWNIRT